MKGINHIFFDLDHTLWDYDRNAQETLTEIHQIHVAQSGVTVKKFVNTFYEINDQLWHKYNHGTIDRAYIKENRFVEIFRKIGVDEQKSEESSRYFMEHCCQKPHLIPHTKAVLDYLTKKYQLHIITNGFEDVQPKKLKASGIQHYFDVIVTSETTKERKPSPGIFQYAIDQANSSKEEGVMIGDNPKTDIHGAREFGMRTILFDPSARRRSLADYSIQSLDELIRIL